MFSNSRDFVINGGEFSIQSIQNRDDVSTTLWDYVASGAMFDSAERSSAGKCHPDTRRRMLEWITEWINDRNSNCNILWLYGAAGAGKSALMQSMCEHLRDSTLNPYGASFFFARGDMERGTSGKLFTTLGYQLAIHFPCLRTAINEALSQDPSIPTKTTENQLMSLIINPLLRCRDSLQHRPILIIDGLDECDGEHGIDTQRHIISLISNSIVEYGIPVRFIIASRPEYWIRDAFKALSNITHKLSLRDDFDADEDIRIYLTKEFENIRLKNERIMRSVVLPWPSEDTICHLVKEASGQYIYATTVLKFVGHSDRHRDPQKQLEIILTPGPHRASAFSELDKLYATILSDFPDQETLKLVVGGLLANANIPMIQIVLGVDATQIILVLDALRSVIEVSIPKLPVEHERLLTPIFGSVSSGREKIRFSHLSFREFLGDKARSGSYHVNVHTFLPLFARAFFANITRNIMQNYDVEPHTNFTDLGLTPYRTAMDTLAHFAGRLYRLPEVVQGVGTLTDLLQQIIRPNKDIKHWLCLFQDLRWIELMCRKAKYTIDKNIKTLSSNIRSAPDETRALDTLLAMIQKLEDVTWSARMLANDMKKEWYDEFKMTPTLVSLDLLRFKSDIDMPSAPIEYLLSCAASRIINTLTADLSLHRHMIEIVQGPWGRYQPWDAVVVNIFDGSTCGRIRFDGNWFSHLEYRNQCINFVRVCLSSAMDNPYNHWEHLKIEGSSNADDMKEYFLRRFFDDRSLSDITGKEYFLNKHNLAFLELMVNSTAWTTSIPFRPGLWRSLENFIGPVLCWFNRQLRDPETVTLMCDYDLCLPQKMEIAMNTVFQHCFLPMFVTPRGSCNDLVVTTEFMEQGSFDFYVATDRVDEELFKTPCRIQPIIPSSQWYPHFAAYLLNILVKVLHEKAAGKWDSETYLLIFPSIVHCLPFAQRNQQNLDALRVTKYLTESQADFLPDFHGEPWDPPKGYCSTTLAFLKEYDPGILSSQELLDFELWLLSLKSGKRTERISSQTI